MGREATNDRKGCNEREEARAPGKHSTNRRMRREEGRPKAATNKVMGVMMQHNNQQMEGCSWRQRGQMRDERWREANEQGQHNQ